MPKSRRVNFTATELDVLTNEVVTNFEYLDGKFSSRITAQGKRKLWQTITDKVNAQSLVERDLEEIRKKWVDYRYKVKMAERARRKAARGTGGGPAPVDTLSEVDKRVLNTIPECQIVGIDGGLESENFLADQKMSPSVADDSETGEMPLESSQCDNILTSKRNSPLASTSQLRLHQTAEVSQPLPPLQISRNVEQDIIINAVTEVMPSAGHGSQPPLKKHKKVKQGKDSETMDSCIIHLESEKRDLLKELVAVMKERNSIEREKFEWLKQRFLERSAEQIAVKPIIDINDMF